MDRKAGRNVQHVPHPQGRQALPEGRRHPEGVVRRQTHLQPSGGPAPVPAPPSPRPTPSWTGSPAGGPPAHPPHAHRSSPRSNSAGRYSPVGRTCPPMPVPGADIGQEHPRLAVGHLPQTAPAVLPGHSHRLPPLLGKVAAVQHPHPLDAPAGSQVLLQPPMINSSSQGDR